MADIRLLYYLEEKYGAKFFTIFILVPYAMIVVGTFDGYTKSLYSSLSNDFTFSP